jgi:hypothetical protein
MYDVSNDQGFRFILPITPESLNFKSYSINPKAGSLHSLGSETFQNSNMLTPRFCSGPLGERSSQ